MNQDPTPSTRNAVEDAIALSKESETQWEVRFRGIPDPPVCAFCCEGRVAIVGIKDHLVWLSENLVVIIQSIPFTACNHCGHMYQSVETKHALQKQIEAIRKDRSLARPIAAYQAKFQ